MRNVFSSQNVVEAHFVQGLLESGGIAAIVQNDVFSAFHGEGDAGVKTWPSVWILDDGREDEALRLIREHHEPDEPTWRCRACGEPIGAQFTDCWRCGTSRG